MEKHLQQIEIHSNTCFFRKSACSITGKGSKDSTLVDFNMEGKKYSPKIIILESSLNRLYLLKIDSLSLFLFSNSSLFWVSPTNSKQINKQRLTCIRNWLTNKESTKGLVKPETWNLHKWYVLLHFQESFVFSGPQRYTLESQRLESENHPLWKEHHLTNLHVSVPCLFFWNKIKRSNSFLDYLKTPNAKETTYLQRRFPPTWTRTAAWNPKQPFINGCFNWMIPNLYVKNGWKSPNIHL